MAKKKAPKKKTRFDAKRKGAGSSRRWKKTTTPARRPGPRSQALPGLEQGRHQKLDTYGETAGEGLDMINAGREQVNDSRNAAQDYMEKHGVTSYVAAGVRFTYTPGVGSVTVKRVKEKGDNKVSSSDADLESGGPVAGDDPDPNKEPF